MALTSGTTARLFQSWVSRREFLKWTALGLAGTAGAFTGASSVRARPWLGSLPPLPHLPQPAQADLPYLTIREAAELIRTRRLSPVELTEAVLQRVDSISSRLNAYITVTREWAMELARTAEAEITRGGYRGPLHGIPIGLKDLYDTAGVLTTAGSKVLADNVPTDHATAVHFLLWAGAVVVGKHNMHEFASGFTNINPHFGNAHTPYKLGHISGGSSGGTAAAVAAGLCLGGMGSDTAGSIRVPSSFCANSGIKPTYGRVSLKGVVPLSWTLDHTGPMARTAEDAAIMLNAVAGYDPSDPHSVNVPAEDYTADLRRGVRGLRLAVIKNYMDDSVLDAEVKGAVERATDTLRAAGATVMEATLPHLPEIRAVTGPIIRGERASYHAPWVTARAGGYDPALLSGIRASYGDSAVTLVNAHLTRTRAIRIYDALMEQYDALLCPTTPMVAPTMSPLPPGLLYGQFTGAWDVTGLPALSVPCGYTADGLPMGLEIIGRRWGERTVLRIGHAYQQMTDWHTRRPPL
ncbi:MAG: amidase [Chloroflexi bacterium]|nr:amidase [Chloroflexota bacterium]